MRRYFSIGALVVGMTLTPLIAGAQSSASIARAVRLEAARLAVDAVAREGAVAAVDQNQAVPSAWASVAVLSDGSEVLVARAGREAATYRLLSVQGDSLTILDVSSSTVPPDVARRLRRDAQYRPGAFRDARNGREVALTSRISIGPSGVSQQGRVLFPLSLVVIDVPRADVDAVSVIRKHVGQHVRRGLVIGAVGGAVVSGAADLGCSGSDCVVHVFASEHVLSRSARS